MIRTFFVSPDGAIRQDLEVKDFAAILERKSGLLWVDFEDTEPESDELILREIFHFHPLAIDDALKESHVPKIDDWGEYLYIVLHSVVFDPERNEEIQTLELDIFVGKTFIVTHHDQPIAAVDQLRDTIQRDERYVKNGADHLLYRLTDEIVANYMPVVDALDDEVDRTEDQVFDKPTNQTLEHIFLLKRSTLHLRRIISPQREVLNKLARDEFAVIDKEDRIYFRDVYDHLVRLYDISESIRDLVSGTLDTYLSVVNNRLNDVMKTLTVITTLFMPISFVASFFGMNFFEPVVKLSGWTGYLSFYFTLALMVGLPVGMFLFMRKRGWMGGETRGRRDTVTR